MKFRFPERKICCPRYPGIKAVAVFSMFFFKTAQNKGFGQALMALVSQTTPAGRKNAVQNKTYFGQEWYGVMKFIILFKLESPDYLPSLFYYVLPLLLGAGIMLVMHERKLLAVLYCPLIIVIRYVITLIEVLVSSYTSGPPSPLVQVMFFFKNVGIYSMLLSMFGGLTVVLAHKSDSGP